METQRARMPFASRPCVPGCTSTLTTQSSPAEIFRGEGKGCCEGCLELERARSTIASGVLSEKKKKRH